MLNDKINVRKLYSFKRLFFDLVPDKCLKRLDERKGCLKRSLKYRLFAEGEKQMEKDIDIVKLLREQKWLMAGMRSLLHKKSPELIRSIRKDSQKTLLTPFMTS